MTFAEAKKLLRRVGTAHATGDSLAAMYADLIPFHCRLADVSAKRRYASVAAKFYAYLQPLSSDDVIADAARRFLREPLTCFEVI